jgi:SNF2-related domain/Helicase conserved C-terminal domain
MAATIVLRGHPSRPDTAIAVIQGGKLDGPAWGRYAAIGTFDRAQTARAFRRADLADVVARLAGLLFTVDPALTEAAQQASAAVVARVASADARVSEAERRSGRTLYPFQRDGARWLASRANALLADEMGTGKTAQSLIAATRRVVVVCPASLRQNWVREAAIWRPDLQAAVVDGLGAFRWPAEGEIVILGYEGLPATAEELHELSVHAAQPGVKLAPAKAIVLSAGLRAVDCPHGVTLIADEGHAFKGSVKKTTRVERWRALSAAVQAQGGSTWVLTATPLLNRPQELWNVGMCAGVSVEAFGTFRRFCELAGGVQGRFALEWHPDRADPAALAVALKPVMLRRMKRDVLAHLPPKQRQTVVVEIATTKTEEKTLARAVTLLASDLDPNELDPGMPLFQDLSAALLTLGRLKYEAAADLLTSYEDAGEPVVVFTTHQGTVDALSARPGWVGFHGGSPDLVRQTAVDSFQAGRAKGIAVTIAAGGVGITLTRAKTAIFLERSWTPALDAQAEDRIHRIGQEADGVTYVTVLADHPLDERISDLQARKRQFSIGIDGASRALGEEAYTPPADLFAGGGSVDFAAFVAECEAEQAERERLAARSAEEREADRAAEKDRAWERRRAARKAMIRDAQEHTPLRRSRATEREDWIVAAITGLALADDDRASEKNGIGFSKSTTGAGHALAWTADLGWTAAQWQEAQTICHVHRRQCGAFPGPEGE